MKSSLKTVFLIAVTFYSFKIKAQGFIQASSLLNYIPKYNNNSTTAPMAVNSLLFDNGNSVIVNGNSVGSTNTYSGELFSVQKSQNATTNAVIYNSSTGYSAVAALNVIVNTNGPSISMQALGTSYTGTGIYSQGAAVLSGTGIGLTSMNIGNYNSAPLNFFTNNTEQMTLNTSGQLILGSTASLGGEFFSIQKNQSGAATQMRISNNTSTGAVNHIATTNSGGGAIAMSAYSSGYLNGNGIVQAGAAVISGSGTSLNIGTGSYAPVSFWTNNTQRITLSASGQVFIGAQKQNSNADAAHQNALLQVNGDMVVGTSGTGAHANIWVTESNWADFVFDKNYTLMPLNEVENFYKTNHHLPNVPSAKQIQETGNNLAQTDVVLLQKIEELTLYVVELKKEVEALKNNKK